MSKLKMIGILTLLIVAAAVIVAIFWQQLPQLTGETTGQVTVIDDVGRNVTISAYPPKRIVSLAASCTEILFALGLGDKVVGVDEFSDYPSEVLGRVNAGTLKTVGSFSEISVETVVGLQPDLIVATGGVQRVVVERLEALGQTVIVLYPKGFDGVLNNILLVGKATGQVDKAEELVASMQKTAQEISEKTRGANRPRVYVEFFFNGGYWSFGSESYVNELIYMAGGINVFAGFPGGHIATSTEEVLKADPEIIVISKGVMAEACGLTPEIIKNRSGWNDISAVKNNRIYTIEESILVLGVPRLVMGLEELARVIHPEIFE